MRVGWHLHKMQYGALLHHEHTKTASFTSKALVSFGCVCTSLFWCEVSVHGIPTPRVVQRPALCIGVISLRCAFLASLSNTTHSLLGALLSASVLSLQTSACSSPARTQRGFPVI